MNGASTIFSLSSARGKAGVSVFRISGPAAAAALQALTGTPVPPARQAALRTLRTAAGEELDRALVLWFKAPASFTGEDTTELHVHGSRAVIDGLTETLAAIPGLRPAEPGEFTRQAFANGRLDLTQVEGLADLLAAETAGQRRLALRQMQGGLSDLCDDWRHRLIRAGAHLEACIDFADEDIPGDLLPGVAASVAALARSIEDHLADGRRGEIVRDGFTVVILGPPNVGKSSLLNALARRDVAIVSPMPGTTRDPVEVHLDLGGYAVTLIDTAGLRDTTDAIEAEGIRRTRARAAAADMRLVVDSILGDGVDSRATEALAHGDAFIMNKADLGRATRPAAVPSNTPVFHLSALTGEGMNDFLRWLTGQVIARVGSTETMPMTRARHRMALEAVTRSLRAFDARFAGGSRDLEILAEDLRQAAQGLGHITGRIGVEDYLDIVFSDFCIGK